MKWTSRSYRYCSRTARGRLRRSARRSGCRPRRAGGGSRIWRQPASSWNAPPPLVREQIEAALRERGHEVRHLAATGTALDLARQIQQDEADIIVNVSQLVADFPEIVECYRMSGDVDYLLRVVVPDIAAYDGFYKRLIERVEIAKVSSAFAMEQIKFTTALPLSYALPAKHGSSKGQRKKAPSKR